jgi:type III pantothenate kinase
MLLAIDIGNTNIHMGVYQNGGWTLCWRARSVVGKMPDEYAVLIRSFLNNADIGWKAITGVILSSTVPPLTSAFAELVERYTNLKPLIVTHKTKTGVKVDVDQPQQVGPDRIVNAAAVQALYGGPAIVVDFGTATTFDVVGADGAYKGGAIAPGIHSAHDALVERAARLHKVDLVPPPDPVGRNTIHAMQSGIFWGYVSLVDGLLKRIKASMGDEEIKVIGTGGLASLFQQHTEGIDTIAPQLTLDGLRVIHALNVKS